MMFYQALEFRVKNYVYILTAAGRDFPTPDDEIKDNADIRRFLLDVNECPVCFNQNSVSNSCCKNCQRFICEPCARKVDKCPFCRSPTPDYFQKIKSFSTIMAEAEAAERSGAKRSRNA
jgi:hypothetical protein